VNPCKWFKNPKYNILITFFQKHVVEEKTYNTELLQCPIKPGRYMLSAAINKSMTASEWFLLYMPMKGFFNSKLIGKVKIAGSKTFQLAISVEEMYEFV
jgi:hypothetical protein